MSATPVLPDVLAPGLKVVFCGTAVGRASAKRGAYYAGPGNRFWSVLYRVGLTPRLFEPQEFPHLLDFEIGLTDLAKHTSGADTSLGSSDFGVAAFERRIARCAPKVLAFNGKKAAQTFYGRSVSYGRQTDGVADTTTFVLPSTSGAAARYWDESHWRKMAAFAGKIARK